MLTLPETLKAQIHYAHGGKAAHWWIDQVIPKVGVVEIIGAPGSGKSTFLTALAAKVSIGRNVLSFNADENPSHDVLPRLKAANADLTRIYLTSGNNVDFERFGPTIPDDIGDIKHILDELNNVGLVTFDPLGAFLSPRVQMSIVRGDGTRYYGLTATSRYWLPAARWLAVGYACLVVVATHPAPDAKGGA